MADEKGYPVSGGNNGGISDDELARLVMSNLSDNFRSILDQLKAISSEIKKVSGQKTSSKPTYQQPEKRRGKELDKDTIELDTRRLLRSLEKAEKNLEKSYSDSARAIKDFSDELDSVELKNIDDLVKKRNIEIDRKYAELEKIELDAKKEAIEKQKRKTEESLKTEKDKQKEYSQELESLKGKTDSESIERSKKLNELLDATLSNIKRINEQSADDLEKINDTFEDRIDKLKRESDKEKRQAAPKEIGALEKAINALNSQKQQSPYLNELLGDENDGKKKTDFEKFEENRKEQLKLLDKASKALDEYRDKLKQDAANGKITQEQLEEDLKVVDKQKANIDRAKQAMEGWTPIRDAMQSAAKSLKDSLQNVIKNLAKFAFERLEDKYLKAYQEGFEKVYQSVENTRNQISARSKLDQGGFSEMQDQIQTTIEEQGLENVVAQSDVNEALISLSSAGITNTDMLKTLALEQAKLNASGSSLKLDNEETLQYLQEFIRNQMATGRSYEDALSDVPKLLSNVVANEDAIREKYGHDMALVGGNMNKIFNEALNMANTAGKNLEQTSSDIGAMMNYGEAQFTSGIDSDTLTAFIREIRDGNIAGVSNFGKILEVNGLTPDQVIEQPLEKTLATINETLDDALANKDDFYIKEVLDAYGISMDRMTALKYKKGLDVKEVSDEDIERLKLERQQANQQGTYYSATQNWQKKAENKMAEIAIDAEKQYKGNTYVEEGFKEVTGLLGSIEDAVLSIGETAIKNGLGNTVGSFFGSKAGNRGALNSGTTGSITDIADDVVGSGATGQNGLANILSKQNVTDFMKGTKGTTAGTVGKVAGGVVGAGIMGYSIISNVKEAESIGEAMGDIFTDPTFYGGLGTTLGSAIAGPIGGAIGGAIGTLTSNIGNWIADELFDTTNDPIQDAANSLIDAANQQIDAANQQIESVSQQINEYNTWGKERKKLELIEQGILSKEEANKLTEEQINATFNDNIINQKQNIIDEQNNIIKQQDLIKKQASDASAFNEEAKYFSEADKDAYNQAMSLSGGELMYMATQNMDYDETTKKTDEWKDIAEQMKESGASQNEIEKAMKEFWIKLGPNAEVAKNYEKLTSTSGYAGMMGGAESAASVLSDLADIEKKSDDDLKKYLISSGSFSEADVSDMTTEELVKNAIVERQKERGLTDSFAQEVELGQLEQFKQRKERYEEADKKFQSKWDKFISKNNIDPKQNLQEALSAYASEYNLPTAFVDSTFMSSDGTVHLDTDGGLYSKGEYIEGQHFKTGLTDVPYDDYPAFLHAGERVLTKEEAEAYNMISSTAIKNAYGNADTISSYILSNLEDNIYNNTSASNVFATRQYGTDNVEKSIDNQTNSLSELLEQILEAIKGLGISLSLKSNNSMSAAKYNVIKGNSNVTQLNTL